jgi:aminomethyltransferase
VTVGSPFHERAAPLNQKMQWREWAGMFAAGVYAPSHDIEYNAIRNAAALIDVSPLYKYRISGPDASRLIDRIITRDAARIGRGRVIYTPWCDEDGKVVDDGTIARLDDDSYRWTAADPQLRWFRLNSRSLDVTIEETSERLAALALQGPTSRAVLEGATGAGLGHLAYYRRRAATIGAIPVDVSRTGYTGDLGYEVWVERERAVDVWDALMDAGRPHGIRPAGMLALDIARLEAGLILLEVDYTSSRHAVIADQAYSPSEIGLGRLVDLDKGGGFVGRRALLAERDRGGPPRRLVGLEVDWDGVEQLYAKQGLTAQMSPASWRTAVPLYRAGVQVGRATSGTWSPMLKKNIALGSVDARFEPAGSRLQMEWTVEARRGRVGATVVPLPFFDPPRKRG